MRTLFYRAVVLPSKGVGSTFFRLIAGAIAAGFYLFLPKRVRTSARFYQALFPEKSGLYAYMCVWRQYQNFSKIFLNRLLLLDSDRISVTMEGKEALEKTLSQKRGAIMLMSHIGNWEVAAHLLKKQIPEIRLLIYMGIRKREWLEKIQKEKLAAEGINIIAVKHDDRSPFHLIEANTFLNHGGLVALTGDRAWHKSQQVIKVDFLGHEVNLPESPHQLALLSERPLFVIFPIERGPRHYHIRICPPITVKAENRADRINAVRRSAQAYANLLVDVIRHHPFEWFHFEPFLGKPLQSGNNRAKREM